MAGTAKVCEHYLRGRCHYGDKCRFVHPTDQTKRADFSGKVCSYFLNGVCKYGNQCKFEHPGDLRGYRQGGGGRSGRHQEDPGLNQYSNTMNNPYKAFNNFNTRTVDSFGPHSRESGRNAQVQFQNPSQNGYGNSNQSRRQVRFNDSGPRVHLYNQQVGAHQDHLQRPGQSESFVRRPLFSSKGGWSNSEDTGQSRITTTQPYTPREIMSAIRDDMKCWVEGNIWPLSSYSYAWKTPSLPGLKDYSPEELRWEAYQATASGKLETYKQQVLGLKQEASTWRQRYASITLQETKQLMERLKFGSRDGNITIGPSAPVFRSPSIIEQNDSFFKDKKVEGHTIRNSFAPNEPVTLPSNSAPPIVPPLTLSTVAMATAQTTSSGEGAAQGKGLANNYSLSSEDIVAFKAKEFVLGKIPINPPPPELCV